MTLIDSRHGVQGWIAEARAALVRERSGARNDSVTCDVVDLLAIPESDWIDLAERAVESNAFYRAAWSRAVSQHAEGKSGARALVVRDGSAQRKLIGLLPVVPAWRALRMPVPVFVAWHAYSPLATPLLDRDNVDVAARALLNAAAKGGAMALMLPALPESSPAAQAMYAAAELLGAEKRIFGRHARAFLDASQNPDEAIRALGAKKIKELRRQRNRLADQGEVEFRFAAPGVETEAALDAFLALEASGWKGDKGTALASKEGDTAFMRSALPAMVRDGAARIATLTSAGKTVAAGVLLRHLRHAYFFKIAYDESAAKMSPGVQLTLDITRAMCADEGIDAVDSTAIANHPMIDHIWRGRQSIADVVLSTKPGKSGFLLVSSLIELRHVLRTAACNLYRRFAS